MTPERLQQILESDYPQIEKREAIRQRMDCLTRLDKKEYQVCVALLAQSYELEFGP